MNQQDMMMFDETAQSFLRLDDLRDQQQSAWQRGERLFVEALVADVSPALSDSELLELIYAEIRLRAVQRETFLVDEYTNRFPQFALFLRRLFATQGRLNQREGEVPAEQRMSPDMGRPSGSTGASPVAERQARPQPADSSQGADRNLLFGILALQMDFIDREGLIDALRDWTTQKDKPLGQILVERGSLSAARRELLEPLVDEHVRRHDDDPAASLASISSISEETIDWHRVHDVDIAESLAVRRLSRNAAGANDTSRPVSERTAQGGERFRVLRPYARGGIGEVFLAFDEELHREVALKEIQSRHLRDEANRERFVREAEVTGGLEHPGIVPVYSLGHHGDGRPFYAMRFIRGDSLKEAIERFHANTVVGDAPEAQSVDVNSPTVIKPRLWTPPSEQIGSKSPADRQEKWPHKTRVSREQFESVEFRKLLGRFIDVCQAIEYAHSRGVLHRDLKPGNIMLGKYGETLVVDWGLAKIAGKEDRFVNVDEATLVPSSGSSIEQTADGSVIGTPAYMSPEQAAGKLNQLGPATDVYSLGATLYHVLTGGSPFDKLPLQRLLAAVQRGDFPRPRELNSAIPRSLEAVCLKAMALQPQARYESSAAIAEDIEHWLADEPVNACRETVVVKTARWVRKHRAWALSGTAALALVAVVATFAAILINGQKVVISKQERDATKLANTNAALAGEKSRLAEKERTAREMAVKNADAAVEQAKLAKRNLYVAHMNLAQAAWDAAHPDQTIRLLELYRPAVGQEGGPNDLRDFEWNYWDRLCHGELLTLNGHENWINSVAFSPDGQRIATGAANFDHKLAGVVKVWDVKTGQELLSLNRDSETREVTRVVFSPDGKHLAASMVINWKHGEVKLWNSITGEDFLTLNGHKSGVNGIAYSPSGLQLASASDDHSVKLWNATTGQELLTLQGHSSRVVSVAYSPDGQRLASAGDDQSIIVWDAITGRQLLTLGHDSSLSVAFSPDGQQLASAGYGAEIKIWDLVSLRPQLNIRGHKAQVYSVTFSPDGQTLASAGADQMVKVWDVRTGNELLTLKGHISHIKSVAYSPDGRQLASSSNDRTVRLWNASSNYYTHTMSGSEGVLWSDCALSPDGKYLASAGSGHTVKVWNAETGEVVRTLFGHVQAVNSVTFSPDGKRLASASDDLTIKVWSTDKWAEVVTLKGHAGTVNSISYSPSGLRLASASNDNTVKLWDTMTGKEVLNLPGHIELVRKVVFSPDGRRLASAGDDKTIKLWDSNTGRELRTLRGHTDRVSSAAFSPDGQSLASVSYDHSVKMWNVNTGRELHALSGHTKEVVGVSFNPKGTRLASVDYNGTLKMWDLATGQEVLTVTEIVPRLDNLNPAFGPDGLRLVSASGRLLKVWDVRQRSKDHNVLPDPADWHINQALKAEGNKRWFAADFHLGRLLHLTTDRAARFDLIQRLVSANGELGRFESAHLLLRETISEEQWRIAEDPDDVQSQFNLCRLHLVHHGVWLAQERYQEAEMSLKSGSELADALASRDPDNLECLRIQFMLNQLMGFTRLSAGRGRDAIDHYQRALRLGRKLMQSETHLVFAISNLRLDYLSLAQIERDQFRFSKARQYCQEGLMILQSFDPKIDKQWHDKSIADFNQLIKQCDDAPQAILDLEFAETRSRPDAERLLVTRVQALLEYASLPPDEVPDFVKEKWPQQGLSDSLIREAILTAETHRNLEPATANSLYDSACCYCLCLKRLSSLELSDADQLKAGLQSKAVATLEAAVDKGWNDVNHLLKDSDLEPLRNLPEFNAIVVRLRPEVSIVRKPFRNLNPKEYQQAFDIAVSQGLRPTGLAMEVANQSIRISGVFVSDNLSLRRWVSRSGLSKDQFDSLNSHYMSQGFQLENHAWVMLNGSTIHAAVWVKL